MSQPTLLCPSGLSACRLRKSLNLNQMEFWSRVGVTQSGGSRYEAGRNMPKQVAWLLHLTYGSAEQVDEMLNWLRLENSTSP